MIHDVIILQRLSATTNITTKPAQLAPCINKTNESNSASNHHCGPQCFSCFSHPAFSCVRFWIAPCTCICASRHASHVSHVCEGAEILPMFFVSYNIDTHDIWGPRDDKRDMFLSYMLVCEGCVATNKRKRKYRFVLSS